MAIAKPAVRSQLARAETPLDPGTAASPRPVAKRPAPAKVAAPKIAAPKAAASVTTEAPDVGAPIDLLPQGGQ